MNYSENVCQNIFIHTTTEELTKAFTELWVKVINENEQRQKVATDSPILQTQNLAV